MIDIVLYVLLFAVLAGAGFVGYVFLTGQLSGFGGGNSLFRPKPEKRLDVVENVALDARRRLVLIRRDDVEHLIMTGGPVDVVIETGIGDQPAQARAQAQAPVAAVRNAPAEPVFSTPPRQPRTLNVSSPTVVATSGAAGPTGGSVG
jgi:hypothetical protein